MPVWAARVTEHSDCPISTGAWPMRAEQGRGGGLRATGKDRPRGSCGSWDVKGWLLEKRAAGREAAEEPGCKGSWAQDGVPGPRGGHPAGGGGHVCGQVSPETLGFLQPASRDRDPQTLLRETAAKDLSTECFPKCLLLLFRVL